MNKKCRPNGSEITPKIIEEAEEFAAPGPKKKKAKMSAKEKKYTKKGFRFEK